jgi:hypothetical protein
MAGINITQCRNGTTAALDNSSEIFTAVCHRHGWQGD